MLQWEGLLALAGSLSVTHLNQRHAPQNSAQVEMGKHASLTRGGLLLWKYLLAFFQP